MQQFINQELTAEDVKLKWDIWWSLMEQGFVTQIVDKRGRNYRCEIKNGKFRMKCIGGQLKLVI